MHVISCDKLDLDFRRHCLFVHYVSSPSSHGCHKHSQGITDGRQGRGGWGNINNIFNTLKIEAEAKFVTERGENKLSWL